jgi:hypothetical protein
MHSCIAAEMISPPVLAGTGGLFDHHCDGERTAAYEPREGVPLKGEDLRIVRRGVETGSLSEARYIAITDGGHIAIYVPAAQDELSLPKLLAH